jgi:lysophospholipase L1-like esterase
VLIGDSIAEGHPALHGRLHATEGRFDPSHADQPGQLSFELAQRLGVRIINQAIGGQSSGDVRKRWARDVLGETSDPQDGRGDRTIDEDGSPPIAVYLHVGINDFSLKTPADVLRENFLFFAEQCRTRKMLLILDNIGAESDLRWFTPSVQESARQFNAWLATDFRKAHPEALLIDYCGWSTGGTGDLAAPRAKFFADDVHPNKAGYADFADFAAKQIHPLVKQLIAPSQPTRQ